MKQGSQQLGQFFDPVQQFQDLNRENFASFGNLDSSKLEEYHLAQSLRSSETQSGLKANQEFKSSDHFKNSTMQTAKYGGVNVPTTEMYLDHLSIQDAQNCVSSSHSIGQHAAYMDYPLQSPVNIQMKQFNQSQAYTLTDGLNKQQQSSQMLPKYQSGMTEDTYRDSVENLNSVRDNSSQGLIAGQKVMKNGKTYTVAGYKPIEASQTAGNKARKNSKKPKKFTSTHRSISNNSRVSIKSKSSVKSKISVSKKSLKSSKSMLNHQQRSVSQKSREVFKDTIKDIMKSNRNSNMNLQNQSQSSKPSIMECQIQDEYKMDSYRRTLEMRNQELIQEQMLCSQAETLKAEREVQEMHQFSADQQKDVCARNFINDAFEAVAGMEAVFQHPSKEEIENCSQSQYQQQSLNMSLNQSEVQRMNFYQDNQNQEISIPSTKLISPQNQIVSKSVIFSQNSSVPHSSKSPEPRNYSQVIDQHNLDVSAVSPAMISEREQVMSYNKYEDINQSQNSQSQYMMRTNSQRQYSQNPQKKLQEMMGSASANQTKACGVVRRNSCQTGKFARGRQPQKVMIDYPEAHKKQRINPKIKPLIPKHNRVETKYSKKRRSVQKNSSQDRSGSRSRSKNSRIMIPSVTSPPQISERPPQDTSTMYRRDSTFFGSSVGRDNSRETKRDLNMTQSNMTISGIENRIYKDIQRANDENRADQIYTFQPTSIQKPKNSSNNNNCGFGPNTFENRQKINHDLINISSPGLGLNASSIYQQSFENQKPKSNPSQDEDVKFVEFLKNVQLYLQQNEQSPKKKNGDHLYQNLQFLREKYKQFSTPNDGQLNEFNYQRFKEEFMETIKQCDITNHEATVKSDEDKKQSQMMLSADVRSNDYPMLQTTLSQELGLKMMHSQSDVTMSARNYEMKLKRMTEEALKPTTVRVKSPPGQQKKVKPQETNKTKILNQQKPNLHNKEVPLATMPEKQKKQIEFIDSIYKKVILKTEKRQSQKQRDISLQKKAKQAIDQINLYKQQDRKQFNNKINNDYDKINETNQEQFKMHTPKSQESQLESNYQNYNGQTPCALVNHQAQNMSQDQDQFSGFFQGPGTDHSSLQSKKNLYQLPKLYSQNNNQPPQFYSQRYNEDQCMMINQASLNQDLQVLDSQHNNNYYQGDRMQNVRQFEDHIEVQKLQSHKYLKQIQGDLQYQRERSQERSQERIRNIKEASFALQNMADGEQQFQDTYVSSVDMGTTQQTRGHFTQTQGTHETAMLINQNGEFRQTHESAMLINQKSSTQNVSIECSTQKSDVQASQCELLDQVKIMQQNIGDPSDLSANQINQTLNALNKTAQELQRACKGITDYANVLSQQQEQQICNIREEKYDSNVQNTPHENQSINQSQDDAFQSQCQNFSEPYSGRGEAGTIDPYPQQIQTGYLTSYQEINTGCRDTFGQTDQQRYLYPQQKDSQTSYFFTDDQVSANQSDHARMQNQYQQQNFQQFQQNMEEQRRDYFVNESMDSMALTNSVDIATRQSELWQPPSTQPSNMKQPPYIGRTARNTSGHSSQYFHTDQNLSQIENTSNFQPEFDMYCYQQQQMHKEISEPRLVTDKDAVQSPDERHSNEMNFLQYPNKSSDRTSGQFIDTIPNTQREPATTRPASKTLELEQDLKRTLEDQKAKSKAQMAASYNSYKYSQQMTSRQLHSLDHDQQTQMTSKHSGEPNMRYESQQSVVPVTDRTRFDFDNKSNTIRSYLYRDTIENKSFQSKHSEGSNMDHLKTHDYNPNTQDKLLKNSTQKEYLSPVSEEFQQRHNQMIKRENTLTPEEFEQAVLAQIKSDETQKGEDFSSNNLMDTKNIERVDSYFYYDPKGYQPIHTEMSDTSKLKQKYIDQMSSGKSYNRTQEVIGGTNLNSDRKLDRDQNCYLKDLPQVGSSSLLGGTQTGKHYDTNQPNLNTLDLDESKQVYADEHSYKNGGAKSGGNNIEFMPTYLLNTMKTSEFSAGQYGQANIQDAFSFRDN